MPAGSGAGLGIAVEGRNGVQRVLDHFVEVEVVVRVRQGHRDIAIVVEHSLVAYAPLRGAGRSPSAKVLVDGVAPLVHLVEDARLLDGTPIDLGDEDGIGLDDRHLLLELSDELALALLDVGVAVHLAVVASVPAGIDVDGIAYVAAFDGMDGVVGIARLEACTRHPDDALETIGSDHIDDGLEVVVQSLRIVLAPCSLPLAPCSLLLAPCSLPLAPYIDRLVGKLQSYLTVVFADGIVLRDDVPDFHQVLLVVVADLKIEGADAWRPYDDVHPVCQSSLRQRNIERRHVVPEAVGVEVADVGLATCAFGLTGGTAIGEVAVVGPGRVEVQAEDVAVGFLKSREHLLEVILAALHALFVVAPAPPPSIEPGIGCVHHAVQYDTVAFIVHQPSTFDMERRKRFCIGVRTFLGHSLHRQGDKASQKQTLSFLHSICTICSR